MAEIPVARIRPAGVRASYQQERIWNSGRLEKNLWLKIPANRHAQRQTASSRKVVPSEATV
jgi:hypothetical protein